MDRPASPQLALNPNLDVAALAAGFALSGRLQIDAFLAHASAQALRQSLAGRTDWRHVINGDNRVFEIPSDQYDAMGHDGRSSIEQAMFASASHGFQFQFDTIRVPDASTERQASGSLIDAFADFMGSPDVIALLSAITGEEAIGFADAQATRYRSGDFLTRHDDAVEGKNRRLAYVLGLTPTWSAEWGGLLLFNGDEGAVIEAMVPRFNALCLFAVGQPHSVSYIAPYAAEDRLSLTGWLRAGPKPA